MFQDVILLRCLLWLLAVSLPPYVPLYAAWLAGIALTPLPAGFFLMGSTRGRLEGRRSAEGMTVCLWCQHFKAAKDHYSFSPRTASDLLCCSHSVPAHRYLYRLTMATGWSEHQLHGTTFRVTTTGCDEPPQFYVVITPNSSLLPELWGGSCFLQLWIHGLF